ncbi:MAG: nuclear transport factor 2 family protein [Chloracidobacterium sp.]|nr:nuclear transport factor 2 family protein [Chloracidobacterium sp.]
MKSTLIIFCFVLAAAIQAAAQCSEADKAGLIKFDKDWSTVNASGDRAKISAIYADEFTAFPTMTGKNAAVEAAVTSAANIRANPQPAATVVADHYMISCSPTTATVTHRNVVTPAGGGDPAYSRSVHFLEKRGGRWVAVSNAGGPLNDADMLRYMELDWINSIRAGNSDWMERNLASDFTEINFMTGEVLNKRRMIDSFKSDKTVFDVMEVSELNIRVDGNTGIVIGKGYARGKGGDGKPFEFTLRFTDTYVKRDGRWLAWASQATQIPASGPTASR